MTHADLVKRAAIWLRGSQRCKVVLTERCVSGPYAEIPDAIGWNVRGQSILVECKVSMADLLADVNKPCRRRADVVGALGRLRYYLTPPGLVEHLGQVSSGWGLLEAQPLMIRRVRASEQWGINQELEARLLVSELSRYQLHGITYPPLLKLPRPLIDGQEVF